MRINYRILSIALLMSCELEDPRLVIPSQKVISLQIVDKDLKILEGIQTLKADSLSHGLIMINLGTKSDEAKEVVFRATEGVLTRVGQKPDSNSSSSLTITPQDRELVVQLNAMDVSSGNVIVSATADNISGIVNFVFEPSYASDFQIQPISANVKTTDVVDITIEAFAVTGKLSENQYFEVAIVSADGVETNYPQFVKLTNQKGKFKIINTTGKAGKATVTIKLPIGTNSYKQKSVVIAYNS